MNWTEVPKSTRDVWFREFKRYYTWKPEYEDRVRRDYEKKCLERLKDLLHKAAKKPLNKSIPWMSETLRADLLNKRKDSKFLLRSEKAKKNCLSGQTIEEFDAGHRQGSVSMIEVTERLAAFNDGVMPSAADVYEKTYGYEKPDGENILMSSKAIRFVTDYQEKLQDYNSKGVTKDPDEVYFEVVGLGSASSLFYNTPTSSQTKVPPHTSSLISQLQSQVEECKRMAEESKKIAQDSLNLVQTTKEAHEKEIALWIKQREMYRANMVKLLETTQLLNAKVRNPLGGGTPSTT